MGSLSIVKEPKTSCIYKLKIAEVLGKVAADGNCCVDPCTLPAAQVWATHAVLHQHSVGTGSLSGCSQMVKNCGSPEKGIGTRVQWCRFLLQAL